MVLAVDIEFSFVEVEKMAFNLEISALWPTRHDGERYGQQADEGRSCNKTTSEGSWVMVAATRKAVNNIS